MEMVLEVSHLHVRRDAGTVVDDVSFSLAAETDTALVGPNGAGKSTLVQAILGILPRQAGEVRFLGDRAALRTQLTDMVDKGNLFAFAIQERQKLLRIAQRT